MKQIRFVEETNGQIKFDGSSARYKGRDTHEDNIVVTFQRDTKVFTSIVLWDKTVRRKGKWTEERVRSEYPTAKGYTHTGVNTNKQVLTIKFK